MHSGRAVRQIQSLALKTSRVRCKSAEKQYASACLSSPSAFVGRSPTGILIPLTGGSLRFVVDSGGRVFRSTGVACLHAMLIASECSASQHVSILSPECSLTGFSTVFITGSVVGFLQHIMR